MRRQKEWEGEGGREREREGGRCTCADINGWFDFYIGYVRTNARTHI